MSEIQPGLFLGGESLSRDYAYLKSNRITHILSAGMNFTEEFEHQFKYLIIQADSNPAFDFYKHFDSISNFIEEGTSGRNRILVHCGSGRGRGSTCVLAYLINKQRMTLNEALATVRVKFPQCSPNFGKNNNL